VPYSSSGKPQIKQHHFKEWGSIDTSSNRQAIKPTDFAWLENFMQIGNANLQSLDGISVSLGATTGGDTVYAMFDANIAGNDTQMCFCTNGNVYTFNMVNATTGTMTKIATGIADHAAEACAQWQNTTALFIGPTGGYKAWNGAYILDLNTSFTITGSVFANVLTVTASPSGFVLQPGMTITTSTPASAPILSYGTGTGGNGAANSANGTYNVTIANVASGSITVTQSAPTAGTCIATYAGRVWIANGRTIYWSAPGSFSDFTVGDAGGALISNDSALMGSITAMIATNNYLFWAGYDSINVISDVRIGSTTSIVGGTTSTATVTLFTNTNISTNIGIPSNSCVAGYLGTIVFMTNRGPYILSGAMPQKLGNNLDGIVPYIDWTKPVCCGVGQVNFLSAKPGPSANIIFWGFNYKDPLLGGGSRYLFSCFFDGKWFLGSAGHPNNKPAGTNVSLTYAVQGYSAGVAPYAGIPCMFGTDGTNVYQLFVNDYNPAWGQIQTALWHHGDPITDKQVMRFGLEASYPQSNATFWVTNDSENGSSTPTWAMSSINIDIWTDAGAGGATYGGPVSTWYTASSTVSIWYGPNFKAIYIDPMNSFGNTNPQMGKYYGFTINNGRPNSGTGGSNAPTNDITVNGILSAYMERARW